jgi:hypothetical protein
MPNSSKAVLVDPPINFLVILSPFTLTKYFCLPLSLFLTRVSLTTQRDEWIDLRRAPRRQIARDQGH